MTTETTTVATPEVLTEEQLQGKMVEAVAKKDWAEVKKLSAALTKLDNDAKANAKAEALKKIAETGSKVKAIFDQIKTFLTAGQAPSKETRQALSADLAKLTGKELDGVDGIWYAMDFGTTDSSIKLMKAKTAASGSTSSGSKGSYVSGYPASEEMLKTVGDMVMFEAETEVVINKESHKMAAGTTFNTAYAFSTNGGWRNRVRMHIGKAYTKSIAQ
jgi:DNA-binding ferritin-like protein (Dps family)